MGLQEIQYEPVNGKTYTLFGISDSTEHYYRIISDLAGKILSKYDIETVLRTIEKKSSKRKHLKKLVSGTGSNSLISYCLNLINGELKQFTKNTNDHLRDLSTLKFWDKRLSTTEEQYHLYMLEIELTNRKNRERFLQCDQKVSLQPYCLQDFSVNCKSAESGFDHQCRFCSRQCFQNHASRILKENQVEPYIWMGASINKAAKVAHRNQKTFGILGIACIPELVHGMRKCEKHRIPVVGIPLNANRCARWFSSFYPNSVDLKQLLDLIK